MGGLREEIRLSVQMLKPTTISNAIGLAHMQEEKIHTPRKKG